MVLSKPKIKVLIVDDSAIVRKILSDELSKDPDIDVLGTAPDPFVARDKILELEPDIITLDIEMPKMDGLTFLQKIMKYKPTPVIIISSTTKNSSINALKAFEYGAVDVLAKPGGAFSVGEMRHQLIEKIKGAYKASIKKPFDIHNVNKSKDTIIDKNIKPYNNFKLIAIGASTGGTEAIKEVIYRLPKNSPGVVIVQHMPPKFTRSFAERMNSECELDIKEAENRDIISKGKVLVAPGDYHMIVRKSHLGHFVELRDGPHVNHQKPAVDVLFNSIAACCAKDTIGVILTGMGRDGANGMLEMKRTGSINIAQDENSCVIFGMPKEAINNGSVDLILPVDRITKHIVKLIYEQL